MSIATEISRLTTAKTELKTAINAKGGTLTTETLGQYAAAVAGLSTGGGGAITKKAVNFYDYDGTLVTSYTVAEAQALSALPTAPDHSTDATPLTFQSWNYTLAQVKATTSVLDVGATYITTDGKTHFHVSLTASSGLALPICLYKFDTSTLTVDWGDSSTTVRSDSGNLFLTHTYAAVGNYIIKVWISSGTGTYSLGTDSENSTVIGASTTSYRQTLTKAFIGANVVTLGNYCFNISTSLINVTIPNSVTNISTYSFNSCHSLRFMVLPSSITVIGNYLFVRCYSLLNIIIPNSITSIGMCAFQNCYSFIMIIVPSSVTSINYSAFADCTSIKKYIFYRTSAPTLASTDIFGVINSITKIYVPDASITTYRQATNWSTFYYYISAISTL